MFFFIFYFLIFTVKYLVLLYDTGRRKRLHLMYQPGWVNVQRSYYYTSAPNEKMYALRLKCHFLLSEIISGPFEGTAKTGSFQLMVQIPKMKISHKKF